MNLEYDPLLFIKSRRNLVLFHSLSKVFSPIPRTSAIVLLTSSLVGSTGVDYIFDLRCLHEKNHTAHDRESGVAITLVRYSIINHKFIWRERRRFYRKLVDLVRILRVCAFLHAIWVFRTTAVYQKHGNTLHSFFAAPCTNLLAKHPIHKHFSNHSHVEWF